MFVKSKTKIDRKRLSKSRYITTFQARFARREKSLVKHFCHQKGRSFDFLSFEGKRVDFGASKAKLRRFKIRRFCDKMRPFCTISASPFFGKSTQIYIHSFILHSYISCHRHDHELYLWNAHSACGNPFLSQS